jgi:hypothetical protein
LQLLSARIRVANASVHLRTRVGKACGRRRRDADRAPRISPVIEYPAPSRRPIVVHVRKGDAGKIAIAGKKT